MLKVIQQPEAAILISTSICIKCNTLYAQPGSVPHLSFYLTFISLQLVWVATSGTWTSPWEGCVHAAQHLLLIHSHSSKFTSYMTQPGQSAYSNSTPTLTTVTGIVEASSGPWGSQVESLFGNLMDLEDGWDREDTMTQDSGQALTGWAWAF